MPDRWARDLPRRRAAGIPDDLEFATKPQLAMRQLDRLTAAGLPARWVAFDEVYGRSEKLRKKAAKGGLAHGAIIPCDYQVTLPSPRPGAPRPPPGRPHPRATPRPHRPARRLRRHWSRRRRDGRR